jgi:hypothetical protein
MIVFGMSATICQYGFSFAADKGMRIFMKNPSVGLFPFDRAIERTSRRLHGRGLKKMNKGHQWTRWASPTGGNCVAS